MKTGWIGLGAMGWPMAGHAHAGSFLRCIWNRTPAKADAFAAQHQDVEVAANPAALAEAVETIVICVSADQDLHDVIQSLEPGLRAGHLVIDHSTVAPATARIIASSLSDIGVGFVDAPVTGGVEGAIQGRLAIMGSGLWDHFHAAEPLFRTYSRIHHHLGPSGSGQAAKAVNQLMVAGIAEAVCEALALMERLDLPREAMLDLLASGAAGSWFLDKRGRSMLEGHFDIGFDPRLLLKDLRICAQLCKQAEFHSTVLKNALADYQKLIDQGQSGKDISALIRIKHPPVL